MDDLIQKTKMYLFEVVFKRMGPAALASVLSAAFAFAAAHQGLLETWGITLGIWPLQWASGQEPSGQVLLIELDTLTKMGLTALLALVGTLGALSAHHSQSALEKIGARQDKPPGP